MSRLHHFILDPYSRRIRLTMAEKNLAVQLLDEKPWTPSQNLVAVNPSGLLPVLIEDSGKAICGIEAMGEYLEEQYPKEIALLPGNAFARAEVRRLVAWFDVKFYTEVSEPLLTEKVVKRFTGSARPPDLARVRTALLRLKGHLDYVALLVEERSWLGGAHISLADLAAAAHISAIDYMGDISWADNPIVKSWYQRIKSRPAFRALLGDTLGAVPPAAHYADLDF